MINILLITAHPDDEIIFYGSSLYEIAKMPDINIYCICLWGALEIPGTMRSITPGHKDIERLEVFNIICNKMNFKNYHIVSSINHPVDSKIPQTDIILETVFLNSLNILNLDINDISTIITHSFYGDERLHPHHIRLYNFFSNYSLINNIGFSFFSILKLLNINHISILHSTFRYNQLHLLSYDNVDKYNICNPPDYMIEFQGNLTIKLELLKLYTSVDYNKHYNDYMAFSVISERIYFNTIAKYVFDYIISNMSCIVKDIL